MRSADRSIQTPPAGTAPAEATMYAPTMRRVDLADKLGNLIGPVGAFNLALEQQGKRESSCHHGGRASSFIHLFICQHAPRQPCIPAPVVDAMQCPSNQPHCFHDTPEGSPPSCRVSRGTGQGASLVMALVSFWRAGQRFRWAWSATSHLSHAIHLLY